MYRRLRLDSERKAADYFLNSIIRSKKLKEKGIDLIFGNWIEKDGFASLLLYDENVSKNLRMELQFLEDELIIKEIQGPTATEFNNPQEYLKALNEKLGMPWPQLMIEILEEQARHFGFKKIKLSNPETLDSFKFLTMPRVFSPEIIRQADSRTNDLRLRIAKKGFAQLNSLELSRLMFNRTHPFKIETRKGRKTTQKVLVTNPNLFNEKKSWGFLANKLKEVYDLERIRREMKQLYTWIAYQNGYVLEGDYFVKELNTKNS